MSKIFPLTSQNISRAATLLAGGKPVAFATETVYGLGADARSDAAVAEIYALKSRPQFNPLISHMLNTQMAKDYVEWNDAAKKLAAAFWPGPMTLVLPRKNKNISLLATAGLDTVAVRVPSHPVARALIEACGFPIAAPSANRSGRVSPTTAQHVVDEFGDAVEMILDGGACDVGIESTVIDCTDENNITILRPGSVTEEDVVKTLGRPLKKFDGNKISAPGMLASHYAPTLPVRLNVAKPEASEALIAFGKNIPSCARKVINLSEQGDLKEAAAKLFAALRELDSPEFSAIAVMPIPNDGIGAAINDRLQRAATR